MAGVGGGESVERGGARGGTGARNRRGPSARLSSWFGENETGRLARRSRAHREVYLTQRILCVPTLDLLLWRDEVPPRRNRHRRGLRATRTRSAHVPEKDRVLKTRGRADKFRSNGRVRFMIASILDSIIWTVPRVFLPPRRALSSRTCASRTSALSSTIPRASREALPTPNTPRLVSYPTPRSPASRPRPRPRSQPA